MNYDVKEGSSHQQKPLTEIQVKSNYGMILVTCLPERVMYSNGVTLFINVDLRMIKIQGILC